MGSEDIERLAEEIAERLIEAGYATGNQFELFPQISELVSDVISEYVQENL